MCIGHPAMRRVRRATERVAANHRSGPGSRHSAIGPMPDENPPSCDALYSPHSIVQSSMPEAAVRRSQSPDVPECPGLGLCGHCRWGRCMTAFVRNRQLRMCSCSFRRMARVTIFVRWQAPLRPRPCHPHHAFEIWPVFPSTTAPATALRRQQRLDQRPRTITDPNPFDQRRPQTIALKK